MIQIYINEQLIQTLLDPLPPVINTVVIHHTPFNVTMIPEEYTPQVKAWLQEIKDRARSLTYNGETFINESSD